MSTTAGLIGLALAVSALVVLHELGHWWVARRCGIKVAGFSIGFGPTLLSWRAGQSQVRCAMKLIPLGGFVQLLDERASAVSAEELPRAFTRVHPGKRIATLGAGVEFLARDPPARALSVARRGGAAAADPRAGFRRFDCRERGASRGRCDRGGRGRGGAHPRGGPGTDSLGNTIARQGAAPGRGGRLLPPGHAGGYRFRHPTQSHAPWSSLRCGAHPDEDCARRAWRARCQGGARSGRSDRVGRGTGGAKSGGVRASRARMQHVVRGMG